MRVALLAFQIPDETDIDAISEAFDTSSTTWWDALTALVIFVAAMVLSRIARIVIRRVVARTATDNFLGDLVGRIVGYVIVSFGLVYALESLGVRVTPILGALGIVGIALAFALQDILENFVAGVIVQLRRPFTAGDEIQSNDHEGVVLAVDARTVTILTPAGETVHLPSAQVLQSAIVNYHRHGRRRTTIEVGVAYDTDLDLATSVAEKAVAEVEGVLVNPPVEVIVGQFGPSSIDFLIRYWHAPSIAAMYRTRDQASRAVARAFSDNGIRIPFPQRVVHQRDSAIPASDATDQRP